MSGQDYDIKLSGPLVADHHCHISYELKQVRITAVGDAPTYVNGEQVSANTLLRHGDRIVIGGTHFFRFNHPNICKSSKREGRKKWDGLTLKDFDFAKKELTTQQNEKLEAELEESQVKAQEGLISFITSAKETAEKQLQLQKEAYKEEIVALRKMLEEADSKKENAEKNQHLAEDKIILFKSHKQALEEDVLLSKKRLQEEAVLAKQDLEENKANQLEIISELEQEKKRIQEDVQRLKCKKAQREVVRTEIRSALKSVNKDTDPKRDLLKIALLLREANKISQKLGKFITFSRDDILENDQVEIRIRLNDTKLGKTTLWPLGKFEYMVAKMRELYQGNAESDDDYDDPFNHPDDEWLDDFILDSPTTPEPGCSRMSIKKRSSLNHSLNMLTNLNTSLSELAVRRRSSIKGTCSALIASKSKTDACHSLTVLHDVFEATSSTEEHVPVCFRLVNMVLQIHSEITCLQNNARMTFADPKPAWRVAMLLQRLRESSSTWSTMNRAFGNPSVEKQFYDLNSSLTKLFGQFHLFLETYEGDYRIPRHSTQTFVDVEQSILVQLGRLSLCSADCYEDIDKPILFAYKHPIFFEKFINGQQNFWQEMSMTWADGIDSLVQDVVVLQLRNNSDTGVDMDCVMNVLNESSAFVKQIKEFMMCLFSEFKEQSNLVITEEVCHLQRGIVADVTSLTANLQALVLESRKSSTGNHSLRVLVGSCRKISRTSKFVFPKFGVLMNLTSATAEQSDASYDGEQIPETAAVLSKLEFASKSVTVGATVLVQSIEKQFSLKETCPTTFEFEDTTLDEPSIFPLSKN